jgi:hypothetical protein
MRNLTAPGLGGAGAEQPKEKTSGAAKAQEANLHQSLVNGRAMRSTS